MRHRILIAVLLCAACGDDAAPPQDALAQGEERPDLEEQRPHGDPVREREMLIRRIGIPARDHAYADIPSQLVTTAEAWERLRALLPIGEHVDAQVDFDGERVAFVSHTEPSGSIHVHFGTPVLRAGAVEIPVHRRDPGGVGTTDMAYHGLAVVLPAGDEPVWKVVDGERVERLE